VGLTIIKNAGWHFTFLGGVEAVKTKIINYPHIENFSIKEDLNSKKIEEDIENGKLWIRKIKYVKIDKTFPKTIQKNQKKYSHLIKK
jgi:beta-1,4-mannosyl-glycoprotein beta-1,4-N-acetylglucosaminyltransferase